MTAAPQRKSLPVSGCDTEAPTSDFYRQSLSFSVPLKSPLTVSRPGLHHLHGSAVQPVQLRVAVGRGGGSEHPAECRGEVRQVWPHSAHALHAGHVQQWDQGTRAAEHHLGQITLDRRGTKNKIRFILGHMTICLCAFLLRMAVCSVPPVKPSTGRKPARSPKARWRSTASASRSQDTQTVEPSRSSTAFHLEYRYVCQTPYGRESYH